MFPKEIEEMIQKSVTPFNDRLASGLATSELKKSVAYLDDILTALSTGFPWYVKYCGIRRLKPDEEFAILTRNRSKDNIIDIAPNTFYMCEVQFMYDDKKTREPINKVINCVYAKRPGNIEISGSKYYVSPILADSVFSIMIDHIFIRLLKAKITVNRLPYFWVANGQRDATQVPWASIYNKKEGGRSTVNANTTLAHYLFSQHGLKGSFAKYAQAEIEIGDGEFNKDTHDPDDWVICESTRVKPRGVKTYYEPSNIQLAIRRDHLSSMSKSMIGAFFYIVDHFPDRIRKGDTEKKDLWATLLGRLIWGDVHEGKILINIRNHFNSISHYVDELILRKLGKDRKYINNLYDLLAYVISKIHGWLLTSSKKINSMWGKELCVLPYVYSNVIKAFHLMSFKLNTMIEDSTPSINAVQRAIDEIKTGLIYGLNKDHGEVCTETCPGDQPAIKLTARLVPQSQSVMGKGKRDRVGINDPTRRFHPSTINTGSYKALLKSNPTGDGRLNLYVQTDENNHVLTNPKHQNMFDELAEFFQRQ